MSRPEKLTFAITGMGCVDCVAVIENAVMPMPGITYIGVSLSSGTMTIRPGPGFEKSVLINRVTSLGYGVGDESGTPALVPGPCPCRLSR
jgi:copper chaperone CopZ